MFETAPLGGHGSTGKLRQPHLLEPTPIVFPEPLGPPAPSLLLEVQPQRLDHLCDLRRDPAPLFGPQSEK